MSQEYIDIPEDDSRCQTEVLNGARHFSVARQSRSARKS